MKSFLTLITTVVAVSAAAETRQFDAKTISKLAFENPTGTAKISATDSAQATVEIDPKSLSDKCTLEVSQTNSILNVFVKKKGFFNFENCEVNFDIKVPKSADLNLTVGSGKVAIEKMTGELVFIIGSGSLTAESSFKKVQGMAGSGTIDIKGLTTGADLQAGSGEISLTYASKSPTGELLLSTGSGDATVHFPKETVIQTQFEAGSGKLVSDLESQPKADFKVSMKAGSGDLKIKAF